MRNKPRNRNKYKRLMLAQALLDVLAALLRLATARTLLEKCEGAARLRVACARYGTIASVKTRILRPDGRTVDPRRARRFLGARGTNRIVSSNSEDLA